jgi:5-(aminomethyl)-3-furanmethanol phosphate kinase
MSPKPLVVAKVGGSLFDCPDLKRRVQEFCASLVDRQVVLFPGGGKTAEAIREFDRVHRLGEEKSHWLALRALTVNGHFLSDLLGVQLVEGLNAARSAFRRQPLVVLDPFRFARGDEDRPDHLPHVWSATSDSLAARVARIAGAERLVLLKSVTIPAGMSWTEAGANGLVDPLFSQAIAAAEFLVEAVNLRQSTEQC